MLLKGKVAVIYGAGGSIGGAVARAFAREGASVFLAGRTAATLDVVADAIRDYCQGFGGFKVALDRVEGLRRQWAGDLPTSPAP